MTNNKIEQLKDLAEALIKSLDYYRINEDWICGQGHDLRNIASLDNVSDEEYERGKENLKLLLGDREKLESEIAMCIENINFVNKNEI